MCTSTKRCGSYFCVVMIATDLGIVLPLQKNCTKTAQMRRTIHSGATSVAVGASRMQNLQYTHLLLNCRYVLLRSMLCDSIDSC